MMLTVVPVAIAADAVAIWASAAADAATAGAAAGTLDGCWACHVARAVLEPTAPTEMLITDLHFSRCCPDRQNGG